MLTHRTGNSAKPLLSTTSPPVALAHPTYTRALLSLVRGKQSLHLDVGAGTGANARFATSLGFESIALEYDTDYLRALSTCAVQGKAGSLPFPEGTFDLVTIIHVLEHLPDYRQSIAEIRRVLKLNGCLIIEVPGKYSLQELLNFLYGRIVLTEKNKHLGHCTYFSHDSLRELLTRAGFIVDAEMIGGGLLSSTSRSIIDLAARVWLKGIVLRGRDTEANDRIDHIHGSLAAFYRVLNSIDTRVNSGVTLFAGSVGFVCRRDARSAVASLGGLP